MNINFEEILDLEIFQKQLQLFNLLYKLYKKIDILLISINLL